MKLNRLAAFLVITTFARVAAANPPDVIGFGSRGAGLANASVAVADDGSANYYNPAGLVRGTDLHIDLSYQLGKPYLKLNGQDTHVNEARGFALGIDAPGHIGPFRFAIGVGIWLPDQQLTRTRQLSFDAPRFVYYDNRLQRLLLSANLAVQIVPGLYIGAGLNYMSRTQGGLELKGTVDPINTDASSLTSNIAVNLLAVRYPQAGIVWEVTKYFTLAAVYRHRFVLSVDQKFRIDGDIGAVGATPIVSAAHVAVQTQSLDHFHPWQLTLAGALKITRTLMITTELTFAAWSDFKTPASNITFDVDVKQFNSLVNLPSSKAYPAAGFHNIVIPRVAAEWRAWDRRTMGIDVRGGYSYEASPVPKQFADSNYADSDKHTFMIGSTFELKGASDIILRPWSFDLNVGVTYLPTRVETKIDPTNRVGDYRANGTLIHFGVGVRSRF